MPPSNPFPPLCPSSIGYYFLVTATSPDPLTPILSMPPIPTFLSYSHDQWLLDPSQRSPSFIVVYCWQPTWPPSSNFSDFHVFNLYLKMPQMNVTDFVDSPWEALTLTEKCGFSVGGSWSNGKRGGRRNNSWYVKCKQTFKWITSLKRRNLLKNKENYFLAKFQKLFNSRTPSIVSLLPPWHIKAYRPSELHAHSCSFCTL